jgi:formiminotetrahydrofolate cyclodeaminase
MPNEHEMTLPAFLEALGSSAPAPGGGAASALAGAIAAALTEMVAQLTVGRPKFAAVDAPARQVLERARGARARLLVAMDDDERAFRAVSTSYKLPKGDDAERATRDQAIQAALKAAMEPPFAVMSIVGEVLAVAEEIARIGNGTVASDAGCAAIIGEAAVRAAGLNVLANVGLLRDATLAAEARQRVAEIEAQVAELSERTMTTVRERMGLDT